MISEEIFRAFKAFEGLKVKIHHFSTIISAVLLGLDAQAFDWGQTLDGYVTRCFQASKLKIKCDDLSEPAWGIKERAELSIEAVDFNGSKFYYGYLKGIEGPLCKEHLRRIQSLLENNRQACITGWGESTVSGETVAHWQAFETKSGKLNW